MQVGSFGLKKRPFSEQRNSSVEFLVARQSDVVVEVGMVVDEEISVISDDVVVVDNVVD
jgi:hypothetical protein